ncbi:MAG: hypothetical protein ACRDMV_03900 [Streptosporangiales bacterium]
MNKQSWSDDDRIEFDALVTEALKESRVADRIDVFLTGLDDAGQAQRFWALDVVTHVRRTGIDRLLGREQEVRRPRVAVGHDGKVIGKAPREVGRTVRDEQGKPTYHRAIFDYLTWQELRDRIDEYQRNQHALGVDIHAIRKLLHLEELVPSATNPAEACAVLGTTVEEFLASTA